MSDPPIRRPWWSYLRFRMRTLIVLVLLVGGGLGWIVHDVTIERDAVAVIEKAGGRRLGGPRPGLSPVRAVAISFGHAIPPDLPPGLD